MDSLELTIPKRELLVQRIINRYYRYKNLDLYFPTNKVLYESLIIYDEVYNTALSEEVITEKELINLLIEIGEWDTGSETQLTEILPKHVEALQKEIYHEFWDKKKVAQIYLYLNRARKEINDLFAKKTYYNYLTAEGIAMYAKIQYIIEHSAFENGVLCDWNKYDLNEALYYYNTNQLEENVIRYLARTYPWTDIWGVNRKEGNLFNIPSSEYTDEQKRIVGWSLLYDNVHEYPDCPATEILEHNDALDGWLIIKKEERDKEKRLGDAERKYGNKAGETFVVVPNKEEAKKIYDLNSPIARAVVQSRINQIHKAGEIDEVQFADSKQKIEIMKTNKERAGK